MPLSSKAHWTPCYIYLQSAVIALCVWIFVYARYQDDAYITLVYARNLLAGHGLVWNPGEVVEGYSNFLFLMLIAGLGWLGMDLVLASKVLSFAGYFGLVTLLVLFTQAHYRRRFAASPQAYAHRINAALCVGLVASSAPILTWCFGGLEEVFFIFLLTAAVLLILRWLETGRVALPFWAGVVFALAAMTRLEGAIAWGVTGLFLGTLWLFKKERSVITFRQLLMLAAGFLLLFAPYMLWRVSYFGDWLPNTYYAKIDGVPSWILYRLGALYAVQLFILPPMLPWFAIALVALTRRALSWPLLYLATLSAVFFFQVMRVGGDHMPYLRFMLPLIPLLALIVYYCNAALISRNEKWFRDICGALLVLSLLQFGFVRIDDDLPRNAISGPAIMGHITSHWPENSLIALNAAGALPYYAPGYRYIDMLGLTDRHIGHRRLESPEAIRIASSKPPGHLKGDGKYVLSRKPDYIIFGDAWGSAAPDFPSDHEIAAQPEFERFYERIEVFTEPPPSLTPALQHAVEIHKQESAKSRVNPRRARGPVLDDQNRVRFIYYRRKKN